MKLAQWLAQKIKRENLKAKDVIADLAATSGVSVVSIRQFARGMRVGTYVTAKAISDATGGKVTTDDLFEPGVPPKKAAGK